MKNPFLNSNDIFQKIDDKKPPTAFQSKHTDVPGYQPHTTFSQFKPNKLNNQNRNEKVYSPLVGANYSQKKYSDQLPLSPVEWGLNRTDYSRKEQNFSYKDAAADYKSELSSNFKNNFQPYQSDYKVDMKGTSNINYQNNYTNNYQNEYQLNQKNTLTNEYKHNLQKEHSLPKYPITEQVKDYGGYQYSHKQKQVGSYSSFQPGPEKQSMNFNSLYTQPHNTTIPYNYNAGFDAMDMKNSYEISKMDKQLTRYLSSHQNIAEITKIFGLGNNAEKSSTNEILGDAYERNHNSIKKQEPKMFPKNPVQNAHARKQSSVAPAQKMKQTFKQSTTFEPFLIVGQDDQNFNQEDDENISQKFNCSFMSWTSKNKGPLFRVAEQPSKDLDFKLRQNLSEQISLRCCRNNIRILLTGDEKIRVKRYELR